MLTPKLLLLLLVCCPPTSSSTTPEEDVAFLVENSEREDVIVLPSGLQYEVLRSGSDPESSSPKAGTPCVCQYEGTLVDGTVFDSTYDRGKPATFAPNQVIPAWSEALQLMREGDKWKLYVPANLGYGEKGAGKIIKPGAALIFELDIVSVKHGSQVYWYSNLPIIGSMTRPISEGSSFTYGHIVIFIFIVYYYTQRKNTTTGRKVAARHILVKELSLATSLKEQIASKTATFEKMASKHSICPSKRQGGFLGEFTAGQMVPAFDQVVWSATIGELSGPVQTQFGYHLIEVTRRDAPIAPQPVGPRPPEVEFKPGKYNLKNSKEL
jgi:FKBP-type peptidyl-prolyl cis-trans isomerase FklB